MMTTDAPALQFVAPGTMVPLVLRDGVMVGANGIEHYEVDGIWDLVRPDRRARIDRFAAEYARVRQAERRAPISPEAVHALPYRDLSGELSDMWEQRAASFDRFRAAVPDRPGGSVLDVGAGCGWLAARLAADGWHAAALDITVEGGDGLRSAKLHTEDLTLVRAEMEALPFASRSVDLVVLNAALHYAEDPSVALLEAFRVLRSGGRLAVLDSPVFADPQAGRRMVEEFAQASAERGTPAADHLGPGFLTEEALSAFAEARKTSWHRTGEPRALIGRTRSWLGARRAGRETARRPLLIMEKPGDTR